MDNPKPTTSPLVRTVMLLLVVAIVGLAVAWYVNRGDGPASEDDPTPVAQAGTKFENAHPDVAYTGSDACAACHHELYDTYQQTAHARSLRKVGASIDGVPGTFHHGWSHLHYRIYEKDGQVHIEERLPLEDEGQVVLADRVVSYELGSGAGRQAYFCEDHGHLVVSPITWNPAEAGWNISPGYHQPVHPGFSQPVSAVCTGCHAGRAETRDNSVNRFDFHEVAIGCERCHGAGALHEARQEKETPGTDGEDLTIANPARMSRQQKMDVCAQCHMDASVTVVNPEKRFDGWRPGMPWNDVHVTYRMPHPVKAEGFRGHVDPLSISACFKGSDSMTCLTCHAPHERPPADEAGRKAYFNQKCWTCHEACQRVPDTGPGVVPREGDDCTGCHMPRIEEPEFHENRTDHRIIVPGYVWTPPAGEEAPELEAHGDVSHLSEATRDRNLGIAYLIFSGHTRFPKRTFDTFRTRAKGRLLQARDKGATDAAASAALARVFLDAGDRDRAISLAEAARGPEGRRSLRPDRRVEVLALLARHAAETEQYDESRSLVTELLSLRRNAFDYLLLSELLQLEGKLEEAAGAAREALAIWPNLPDVQYRAAECLGAAGDRAGQDRANRIGATIHKNIRSAPPR